MTKIIDDVMYVDSTSDVVGSNINEVRRVGFNPPMMKKKLVA